MIINLLWTTIVNDPSTERESTAGWGSLCLFFCGNAIGGWVCWDLGTFFRSFSPSSSLQAPFQMPMQTEASHLQQQVKQVSKLKNKNAVGKTYHSGEATTSTDDLCDGHRSADSHHHSVSIHVYRFRAAVTPSFVAVISFGKYGTISYSRYIANG